MIDTKDIDTIKLVDVRVNSEDDGVFTFSLKYRVAYKDGKIEEIEFPRVTNPFYEHSIEIHQEPWLQKYIETKPQSILKSVWDDNIGYSIIIQKVIKEADPVEMTMDEIEAALGKRVKIVNKGDKK